MEAENALECPSEKWSEEAEIWQSTELGGILLARLSVNEWHKLDVLIFPFM